MKKILIIGVGLILLGVLATISSCEKDGDDDFVSCSNTCSSDQPYSNQNTSSCYETLSDCAAATGETCKNCN